MRMFRMIALATLTVLAVACGGNSAPTVTIEAKPSKLQVGAGKYTTITIGGKVNNAAFPEGMVINQISTNLGSFQALAEPTDEPTQTAMETVSGSVVILKLYAPPKPGVATVTVRVVDSYGASAEAKVNVTFTAPQAARLNFSCRSQNIGVLANTSTDFALACDASALDTDNNQVKSANIRFLAEAGSIRKSDDSAGDLPDYVYYPRQGEEPLPKDVAPLTGEPSVQVGDKVRNPRDMLATLVAYTDGDNPQNGDMFAGDPFVDKNDNGVRDDDEPFFSADGSGAYNPAQTSILWKQVKVVWSGAISTNKTIAKCEVLGGTGSLADLARSGTAGHKSFKYTLLDDYYNVLSANDLSDMINWQLTPSGQVDFDAGQLNTTALTRNETGMALDSKGNLPKTTTAATFTVNSSYTLKVYNARSAMDTDGDKQYTVTGSLQRALTIDDYGEPDLFVGDELLPACGGILK
jgi:hypothetical protein